MHRFVIMTALMGAMVSCAFAQDKPEEKLVLAKTSYWRYYYTIMPPVRQVEGKIEKVVLMAPKKTFRGGTSETAGVWLEFPTDNAPAGWHEKDFDDSGWNRRVLIDPDSPWVGHLAMRGKFHVEDPEKVKGLTLRMSYRGGVVVYLNGKEIGRGHVKAEAGDGDLAEEYLEADRKQVRELTGIAIPGSALIKGANVLALEVFRSAMPNTWIDDNKGNAATFLGGTCGVMDLELRAGEGDAVTANVLRPAGVQVWNSDPMAGDHEADYGEASESLKAIRIVVPRNGAGSGKVVVAWKQVIKGLKGTVGDLTAVNGGARIAAGAVKVRYALPTVVGAEDIWGKDGLAPHRFDALEEKAPAQIEVRWPRLRGNPLTMRDLSGAVAPVWVTVAAPADARSGEYRGTLTITMEGHEAIAVPIEVTVSPWKSPDPKDFQVFTEVVESPESVAMWYDVPLWSEEHWKLVGKSLKLLGEVGNKTCYIPLICHTNLGNEESMVRWIKQADGSYKQDYSAMDRYLDEVEKNQGKPTVVCFWVWDTYLEGGLLGPVGDLQNPYGMPALEARKAHEGKGPQVTMVDPATGKVEKGVLPMHSNPESRVLWEPVMKEIRERMKKRGLEKTMMLGTMTDMSPTQAVVDHFAAVSPGTPWVGHAHLRYEQKFQNATMGYRSTPYAWGEAIFAVDPTVGRTYGWALNDLYTHNPRTILNSFPMTTWRFLPGMNASGTRRGFSRMGGDFFAALKDKQGRRVGSLSARFPESTWRCLNIETAMLGAGQEGPVGSARLEMMREGLQECEARIAIEKALLDEKKRTRLGEEEAKRLQALLDDRVRDMRRAVCSFEATPGTGDRICYSPTSWWNFPGTLGNMWFVTSGWQEKTLKLYEAAAAVEEKLNAK